MRDREGDIEIADADDRQVTVEILGGAVGFEGLHGRNPFAGLTGAKRKPRKGLTPCGALSQEVTDPRRHAQACGSSGRAPRRARRWRRPPWPRTGTARA